MIPVVALVIATATLPGLAAGATPEAIRACVERNLVRYTSPGSAVVAQYTDLETACIAALDGSGTSVQFTGDPGESPAARPSDGTAGAGDQVPADADGTEGGPPRPGENPEPAPGAETPQAGGQGAAPVNPDRSAVALVQKAASQPPGGGTPTPESLSGTPWWFAGLLGAIGLAVAGAIAFRVLRRPR